MFAVLRSGGDFQPRHVQALQRQIAKWGSGAKLVCLSDVDVPGVKCIPLKYDWPGWWAKLELFRPDLRGDFLTTDLDNILLGPIDDILAVDRYTTQVGDSNALAYLTEEVRALVWKEWIKDPDGHMHKWHPNRTPIPHQFGDGGFIKSVVQANQHWEELLPGQVINLVTLGADKAGRTSPLLRWPFTPRDLPKEARILLCWRPHRPWLLPTLRRVGMYD